MIRPCPTRIECPGELGTDLFGNGDNPFLNLSIEGPEQHWVPPPTEYFTATGRCCDGLLKFTYGDTQELANTALNQKISKECDCCDCPDNKKTYCADAKCPDVGSTPGGLIARVCLSSSYADALKEANRIKASVEKFCPHLDGKVFRTTCSCSDGSHEITVSSPDSQAAANSLCLSSLPQCSHGQDSGDKPDGDGDGHHDNPYPDHVREHTPPPPNPGTICNTAQECTVYCPDGSPFTKHVAACLYYGKTQKEADDKAHKYACDRAVIEKICIGDLAISPCLWTGASGEVTVSGLGTLIPSINGQLPSGMTMGINDTSSKITISGAPEQAGFFDFTLQINDAFGNTQTKDLSFSVFGATDNPALPLQEGAVGECYSHQFAVAGPYVAPLIWQITGLPPGVTHDGNGKISGTPEAGGDYDIGVTVGDSDEPEFRQCFYDYALHIRDCAVDTYNGVIAGTIDGASGHQTVNIPKQICAHFCSFHSTNFKTYGCTGSLTATVKKDGVQVVTVTAATASPFQASLDSQGFAMPAQAPASPDCPASPAFNEVWTVEFSGGTAPPGKCGINFSISGV